MDNPKLLPCPFERHHSFQETPYESYVKNEFGGFRVHCSRCGTVSPAFDDKETAIECWNAAAAAAEQMYGALKRIAGYDGMTNLDPESINDVDYGRGAAYAYAECASVARTAIANYEATKK